ncbi:OmpA family protein [Rhizorhabdus histidinilytica]|jgi:outer membrane protein OmpA-like peptidoglycan-associated protein|uniref:Outer membrane protein OmpA n=1 Tax=Rhizorhabdus histidinilytica TaxID=439228 RepID=A0A1T5FZ63_9SPHN|nr:OmpA family protein [Rhizorhabdus histidinilytica]QEH81439.1 OmpA family protein [Sphingomonas sp. C8-2]SKC01379.1 Outer membrane protein OmpA [Rhizorhabdus histidinilytica]
MNRLMLTLAGATALAGLAAPALADKTDKLVTDQYREKIAVARAEPGVAEYGAVYLDRASERIAKLDKKLDNDKAGQAEAVAGEIDALIETARTRAKVAMLKKDVEQAKADAASRSNAQLADAQAAAASAQADAAAAQAEAARLKAEMRDYQLRQTQLGATLVLQDVVFETGKADLKPGAAQRLQPLAQYLQANKDVKVRIDGHTDSQGSDGYNQQLSEARAQSVRNALAGLGVAPDRITAVGHGEAQPVADNRNAAGRQQNRRVEVTLVGQQASSFAGLD